MESLTSLSTSGYEFISSDMEPKVKAIRELINGDVIDVRELECIGNHTLYFKSGNVLALGMEDDYRRQLIDYWRYFNGV
jgi:hypothetical protein